MTSTSMVAHTALRGGTKLLDWLLWVMFCFPEGKLCIQRIRGLTIEPQLILLIRMRLFSGGRGDLIYFSKSFFQGYDNHDDNNKWTKGIW